MDGFKQNSSMIAVGTSTFFYGSSVLRIVDLLAQAWRCLTISLEARERTAKGMISKYPRTSPYLGRLDPIYPQQTGGLCVH